MLNSLKTILQDLADKQGKDDFYYPYFATLASIAFGKKSNAKERIAALKMLSPYIEKISAFESKVATREGEQLELDFESLDKIMIKKAMEGDTAAYNALVRKASTLEDEDENDYQVVKRLVITPVDMSKPKDDGTTEEED